MPDIFLYTTEPNPNDIKLGDPTARRFTYTLELAPGLFSLVGAAVRLAYIQNIPIFLYTGEAITQDIRLRDPTQSVAGVTQYTLSVDAGSYLLSGTAASLLYGRLVVASGGTYVLSGTTAGLLVGYWVDATAGTYLLSGTAAGLLYGRVLSSSGGLYLLAGTDANFLRTYVLDPVSGLYLLTGTAATLTKAGAAVTVKIHRVNGRPYWSLKNRRSPTVFGFPPGTDWDYD